MIRRAAPGDLPAIGRLAVHLVHLHHEFDPDRFLPVTPQTEASYASFLGAELGDPEVVIFVAERQGDVIGYAYAGLEGHDYVTLRGAAGVLHDLVVDAAHRGRGVGRLLLDAATAALERMGAPRVVLSTAARNAEAQRLFTRAGFRPTMIEMTREAGERDRG